MKKQDKELKFLTQGGSKKALSKIRKSVKFNSNRKARVVKIDKLDRKYILDSLDSLPRRSSDDKKLDAFFDNLITIEELADYIGVSQKTIRNWVALRSIPFLRIGKKTFFIQSKICRWFQTKEFEPCQ